MAESSEKPHPALGATPKARQIAYLTDSLLTPAKKNLSWLGRYSQQDRHNDERSSRWRIRTPLGTAQVAAPFSPEIRVQPECCAHLQIEHGGIPERCSCCHLAYPLHNNIVKLGHRHIRVTCPAVWIREVLLRECRPAKFEKTQKTSWKT